MRNLQGKYVDNPPAYCVLHKCHLSMRNIRKRRCIEKQCFHMKKLEHPYWEYMEIMKKKRKERRESRKELIKRKEVSK